LRKEAGSCSFRHAHDLGPQRAGTLGAVRTGAEVVVVHPDGVVSGPPTDVAAEVGRLAAQERQGELDRQAARTIQQLLAGDGAGGQDRPRRLGDRTWSIPATAYWLSGPDNDHGTATTASRPGGSASPRPPRRRLPGCRPAWRAGTGAACVLRDTVTAAATSGGSYATPAEEAGRAEDHGHLQQLPARPAAEPAGRGPWPRRQVPVVRHLAGPHYTLLLADIVRRAERAGTDLERLGENRARLHIRPESVLDSLRAELVGAEAALHRLGERRAA
jgi:hypothetical protein